ncbi:MAG: hypothetical protein ABI630_08080 [Betaproteobacteria bacterium]
MSSNRCIRLLLGSLALGFAASSFAAQPLPVNPMLIDAMTPAAPRAEALSLAELENRLLETKAIPSARKAELTTELDALLDQFRRAFQTGNLELSSLREPYDRLLAKMQSLAKKDRRLARDIAASSEPLWDSLTDRATFASLQ